MAPGSSFAVVVGTVGVAWFAWHFVHPRHTGTYWPGLWFGHSSLSVASLRVFAVGGVLEAAGIVALAFYPDLNRVAAGVVIFLLGATVQAAVTLLGTHNRLEPMDKDQFPRDQP